MGMMERRVYAKYCALLNTGKSNDVFAIINIFYKPKISDGDRKPRIELLRDVSLNFSIYWDNR
jgi:hypothetical protein